MNKKQSVSKAVLLCVKGSVGSRLIKDIKGTRVDKDLVKNCKKLIEKLSNGEFTNKE